MTTKNILKGKVNAIRILKLQDKIEASNQSPSAYATIGKLLSEQERYDSAIEYLIQGSRLYPTDPIQSEYQRYLGSAYYYRWIKTNQDIDRAHAHFEHCLKFPENTSDPFLLYQVAETYRALGALEGAIKIYSHIIEHFPAYINLRRVVLSASTALSYMGCVVFFSLKRVPHSLHAHNCNEIYYTQIIRSSLEISPKGVERSTSRLPG